MTPAISVVVPVLNMADTIGACLDALAAQTLPATQREIIVVDNGSRDGTLEIVRRYPVTLAEEPRPGAPGARNRGVMAATGSLVAFTDADCVPSRSWLRHLVDAARRPGVDIVAGPMAVLDPAASLIARYSATLGQYDPVRTLAHPRFPYAATCNLAIRRALLTDVGMFDPAFPTFDAAELFWRMRRRGPLAATVAPRAVVFYRTRASMAAFIRQNYGYGRGVGRYCRRIAADEGHPPGTRALMRSWGRRMGMAGRLARSSGAPLVAAGLVGVHVIREVAIATGTLAARVGTRP